MVPDFGRRGDRFVAVFDREWKTVARTRLYWVVAVGFAVTVLVTSLIGGISGYVAVVLKLLTPLEILLPVLGAAFGYRALLVDRASGELAMLRTFPLSRLAYVSGVLVGRLTLLLGVVTTSLLLVGLVVPFATGGSNQYLLRQTTYNGPLLYVRFTVLTALATVVFGTVVTAISAAASESRRAVALAVLLVVGLTIGLDLAIVTGYAVDVFSKETLPWLLAMSPASAYRGLVLELVIEPAAASSIEGGWVLANVIGLLVWLVGSLAVATRLIWDV